MLQRYFFYLFTHLLIHLTNIIEHMLYANHVLSTRDTAVMEKDKASAFTDVINQWNQIPEHFNYQGKEPGIYLKCNVM